MAPAERRSALSLAGIFGLRMLGLFLILPVLSLYARDLPGATPLLVGMALGAYGLTQALLQVPFGAASDRLGRKPVIAFGLVVFALGSVVAAVADDIYLLLLGRTLQGAGAIAYAVIAMVADLTREETRTRAMALIGMTIGASFTVSLVAGPSLAHWLGVPG
ncbi:MAG: MFS transporter, partial [Thiohalorhabdaceae bacterium]